MKRESTQHIKREDLIDFVDGGIAEGECRRVSEHLAACRECRAYVDSLRQTLEAAAEDAVPEQSEAYWTQFESVVRRRAGLEATGGGARATGGRMRWLRLAPVLAPGAVVAVALVLALVRLHGPVYFTPDVEPPLESMATGEIASSIADDEVLGDMVVEAAGEDITSIEEYLLETESLDDLIDGLADEEQRELATRLEDILEQKGTKLPGNSDREKVS
ncbi:MAG: zf-HC2 domain-containing protein [bacterium]